MWIGGEYMAYETHRVETEGLGCALRCMAKVELMLPAPRSPQFWEDPQYPVN